MHLPRWTASIVEPTELLQGILEGKVPTPIKEDLRIAAKRQRDRERYAKQTHIDWKKHDAISDDRPRNILQPGLQSLED
jgi:hypothetical protein